MAKFGTGVKIIAGGAALLLLSSFAKASSIVRLGKNLVIENSFKVAFEAGKLILTVVPTMKNPSNEGLSLRHPFIRLRLAENGETVASSDANPTIYQLEPFKNLTLNPIVITLSTADLILIGTQIGKDLFKTKRLTLYVDTIAHITGESIPFDKTDKYELKLPF